MRYVQELKSLEIRASMSGSVAWALGLFPNWVARWFRWCPTSSAELEVAEKKILSCVQTPYTGKFCIIDNVWGQEKCQIWTLTLNGECKASLPLVMVHGFCSGVGLWAMNLDSLSANRALYCFDLPGFGRSSRPKFSADALEAEFQLVETIEKWRQQQGLERFILLGHSFGGFLAASYALHHPDHIAHLILADPWGIPERPIDYNGPYRFPIWMRAVERIWNLFNPLAVMRLAGPWGPRLVERFRPDLRRKFEPLVKDQEAILNYVYHCNAQYPSGELAFKSMTARFGWAKHPMVNRMANLKRDIPITFIYGSRSWVDRQPGFQVKYMRLDSYVEVQVVQGAGHHVYADRAEDFNVAVNHACSLADSMEDQCESENQAEDRSEPIINKLVKETVLL